MFINKKLISIIAYSMLAILPLSIGQTVLRPKIRGVDQVGQGGGGPGGDPDPNMVTTSANFAGANLPIFSNGANRTIKTGSRAGNTTRVHTCTAAALVPGKQLTVDADQNCVSSIYDVGEGGVPGGGSEETPFEIAVDTGADTITLTALRDINILRGKETTTILEGENFVWDTPAGADQGFRIWYDGGMRLSSVSLSGIGVATTSSRPISAPTSGLTRPDCDLPILSGSVVSTSFTVSVVNEWVSAWAPFCITVTTGVTKTYTNNYTINLEVP